MGMAQARMWEVSLERKWLRGGVGRGQRPDSGGRGWVSKAGDGEGMVAAVQFNSVTGPRVD
jgi:hypothetical protein